MAERKEHLFHQVASELRDWISESAKEVAFAMHDGPRPPFAADVGDRERLDYYEARLFNPDGTPNELNRQAELQRIGTEGYATVLLALKKRREPGLTALPQPIEEEAPYG